MAKQVRMIEIDYNVYKVLERMKQRYNKPLKRIAEIMICDIVDMAELHEALTGSNSGLKSIKPIKKNLRKI